MPNLSTMLVDEFNYHATDLSRVEADLQRQIIGMMQELRSDLERTLRDNADLMTDYSVRRHKALMNYIDDTIKVNMRGMRDGTREQLVDLADAEKRWLTASTNGLIGAEVMNPVGTSREVLERLVDDTLIVGSPASEWWSRQAGDLSFRFSNEVRKGVLTGENLNDIVKRVRGTSTGVRYGWIDSKGKKRFTTLFKGGVVDATTAQAEALVRSSVQAVANTARLDVMDKNTDIIKGYVWRSTLDSRTSDICKALDGQSWDTDKQPIGKSIPWRGPPPAHFNCRSVLIPITKSWADLATKNKALAKKIDKMAPNKGRSSMDGEIPAGTTYEEWLGGQSAEFQRKVLGANKYRLWKEGKINFRDLVDETGRPLTVAELKVKVGELELKGPQSVGAAARNYPLIDVPEKFPTSSALNKGVEALKDFGMESEYASDKLKTKVTKQLHKILENDKAWTDYINKSTWAVENINITWKQLDESYGIGSKFKLKTRSEQLIAHFVNQWTVGSSRVYLSNAMQLAAEREFGVAGSSLSHVGEFIRMQNFPDDLMEVTQSFLRAQYNLTQKTLKEVGVDYVYLYRGMVLDVDKLKDLELLTSKQAKLPVAFTYKPMTVAQQPLSSWTFQLETADEFSAGVAGAESNRLPIVFGAKVPVSRILATSNTGIGCLVEGEFVVLGGTDDVMVQVVKGHSDLLSLIGGKDLELFDSFMEFWISEKQVKAIEALIPE